ncbi:MAG: mevalonate kinase [Cardiobacteriaceae bacterium]|nr:mevalonate kinase [Cardiobacteriaceae bacterium]
MIHTSAPGSLMISGEHAVVYGHPAIVCAIDQRIHVRLAPGDDGQVHIESALGHYCAPVGLLHPDAKLRFVLACLERYPGSGALRLHIDSAIDPTLGLGSSAAVTVATLAALAAHGGHDTSLPTLHAQALTIIRGLQGRGSGADLAASLWGGMIAYRNLPTVHITPLPLPPAPPSLRYAGYKTPTGEVLAQVAARMQHDPGRYEQLYQRMGETTAQTIAAAQAENWPLFYSLLNRYQQHLHDLGVCDATQQQHLHEALRHPATHAAKISGSGLGDCIVAFAGTLPAQHSPIRISRSGLMIENQKK